MTKRKKPSELFEGPNPSLAEAFRNVKVSEQYILDKGEKEFRIKFAPMIDNDIWGFVVEFINKNYVPRCRLEETIELLEMIKVGFRKISVEELIRTFKTLLK